MLKRAITLFLLLALCLQLGTPAFAVAQGKPWETSLEANDYSIDGANSLGSILAEAMNDYKEEPENASYAVTDLESDDSVIYADVTAQETCTLAVYVLDEFSGEIMSVETKTIPAGEGRVCVTLDQELPEHYVTQALLLDGANDVIGEVYTDNDHTQWYEDYLDTNMDDFSGSTIIQLENSTEDNFAVLLDSVVLLEDDALLRKSSESTYVFAHTEQTDSLSVGDVFAYRVDDVEELLIGKVSSLTERSDILVVDIDNAELDETFSFVKIHCEVDQAFADDPDTKASASGDKTYSKTWEFSKGAFSGSITLSASLAFSLEYSLWDRYAKASLSISPSGNVHAEVNFASGRITIPVAKPTVMVYGVAFSFQVNIIFQASAKVTFDANISAKFGFSWDTDNGKKNTSKKPTVTSSIKIEGHIYLGLELVPSVSLLGVATLSLSGEAGAQLNASMEASYVSGQTEKHDCGLACIAGDVDASLKVSASLKIKVVNWSIVDKTWSLINKTYSDVLVFHYSIKHNEFGLGPCKHMAYLLTINVVDESGKPLKATVDGKATSNGIVKLWYNNQTHILKIRANGYESLDYSVGVNGANSYTIVMKKGNSDNVQANVDSSYVDYNRGQANASSGYGGYTAPLSYVEPAEGVRLSTSYGSYRRSDVAWVQRELTKLGYNCSVDGYYGTSTASAVRRFQQDYLLPVNGVVDSAVVAVIKRPLKMVGIPKVRLLSADKMPTAGIASIGWDAVENAECYEVRVFNEAGNLTYSILDTKATNASFALYMPGSYTVKVLAKNARFTGEAAVLNQAFTVLEKLTVTFVDWDGTILSRQFVEYGQDAVTPASPERDGHSFYKWDLDYTKVTQDFTVTALYNKNQYKVTFLDCNGKEILVDKCAFAESAIAPVHDQLSIPVGCELIGWDKDFSCVIEDIVVSPVVRYINEDLPIIIESSSVVQNGSDGYTVTVVIRNYDLQRTTGRVVVALKTENERFLTMTESSAFTLAKSDYTGNNISKTTLEIFIPCTQPATYIDVFAVAAYDDLIPISETKRLVLSTGIGEEPLQRIEGVLDPSLAGSQAILFIYKIGDASDYTNEFIGQTVIAEDGSYCFNYNLREEPSVKTGDYTVVLGVEGTENAIYLDRIEAPKPVYTVTIRDYDGTVLSQQQVMQGENAVLPEDNPEREGYIFAGWDYSNSAIYEDQIITAIYVPKRYTVVFIDWTNHRFDMDTYTHGETLIMPDLSSLEEYTTIGWDVPEGTKVTQNMVITAKYEKKTFNVQFYDYEGNLFNEQVVEYGEDAQAPAISDDEEHIFYDWDTEDLQNVRSAMTIRPLFCYTETAETPVADLQSGIYRDTTRLSLSCEENATIYYAVDGGQFVEYTAPIEIAKTTQISYYASCSGKNDSPCLNGYYIINREGNEGDWKYPVYVYDGSECVAVHICAAGTVLNAESLPYSRVGYILEGYYADEALTQRAEKELFGEARVYVKLVPEEYTVEFRDVDGELLSAQTVAYLQEAQEPDVPDVPEGFVFSGWDTDAFFCVTDDVTVTTRIVEADMFASIRLDRAVYTMMEDYSHSLTATITGADGFDLLWSSSDTSIATVDSNGRIHAIANGVVVITASVPALGLSSYCYVTVLENPDRSVALLENSIYTVSDGYICGISPDRNTVQAVLEQLASVDVVVFCNETELGLQDKVCTGTVVQLYAEDGSLLDEKILVVRGDVDGDGLAGVADVSHITRSLLGKEVLEGACYLAADANGDGTVNNKDASLIMRYLVSKDSI